MKSRVRYLLTIAAISLGGAVVGIDAGIIATTIAQPSFNEYMFPPGTKNASSLLGAIISMGSAGTAIGALLVGFSLEKLGRRYTLALSTFCTMLGALFQTVANGVPLMVVGRIIGGMALGFLFSTIPVYISELSQPHERARLIGIFGLTLGIGFCVSNWIGYACSYGTGSWAWRLELAMQLPLAIILFGFCFVIPESPRWLAEKNQMDKFESTLRYIYGSEDEDTLVRMKVEIREQVMLEAEQRNNTNLGHAMVELFSKKYIRRTAMAIAVVQVNILSGGLAIQNYQSLLFGALGFTGQKVLLISGCFGFMGIIGQLINLAGVSDRLPRVRTMWIGCIVLAVMLVVLAALSKEYGDGKNANGARAGIAFIFLFSVLYGVFFNSTIFTIAAEMFPQHLRGYGMGISSFCQGISGIWMGQVTPYAFEAITWKYYFVFIGCLLSLGVIYAVGLVETNQVSLEEIAGKFGDKMVDRAKIDTLAQVEHVEENPDVIDAKV
ncbi:general substrate transporter [Phaeosphaeriaceae sp. PMI808]|nr:general substrate transporter [Phaeosphaeriaceae sp. PMI808]